MSTPQAQAQPIGSPETFFPGRIALPYTLTAGRSAGLFLAELANQRIVGSRCPACHRVLVPAQDFCAPCGTETDEYVELPQTGSVGGFTETSAGLLALIRLDGADVDLVHRILDSSLDDIALGDRVTVRWAEDPQGGILDIEGFAVAEDASQSGREAASLTNPADPVAQIPYEIDLHYEHAYGPYYGRLFDELATTRRIQGVRCPSCKNVLVPPRDRCDVCFARTGEWVDVADTGVVKAFSIIHLEFVGQTREPPYVYAEIILDGASTRLIHAIGGIDVATAKDVLFPGIRVGAVWREDAPPKGTLEDIVCFQPIGDAS
jgi:uncharacterized OB-fold protein